MADSLPKMELWYYPMYRSTRCIWLVKELGIEDSVAFKYVPIGPPPHPPERIEYQKSVHCHSTVPALVIEGHPPMLESGSICMYLADLCGRLVPEPSKRSEYFEWIMYCASRLDEAMTSLTMQWMFKPEDQWDQQIIAKAQAVANLCLDRAEETLKDRPFIIGDEFSAADCVLGYNMLWASHPKLNGGVLMEGRSVLKDYLSRLQSRPAFQQALAMGK